MILKCLRCSIDRTAWELYPPPTPLSSTCVLPK